jgi:hypothetical protein
MNTGGHRYKPENRGWRIENGTFASGPSSIRYSPYSSVSIRGLTKLSIKALNRHKPEAPRFARRGNNGSLLPGGEGQDEGGLSFLHHFGVHGEEEGSAQFSKGSQISERLTHTLNPTKSWRGHFPIPPNQKTVVRKEARPHPNPLPRGEGDIVPATNEHGRSEFASVPKRNVRRLQNSLFSRVRGNGAFAKRRL